MSDAQVRIWKEVVLAYVKVLSLHFSRQTEKNHEYPQEDTRPGFERGTYSVMRVAV
jgi:hypothetical protein